mmetsp:Transcript_11207/g.17896  ORF Transcript_11207/g.17896 Transcript_11207/m.17896 type:complete len:221 (-) Transcript_11207:237-899(-)
MTTAWPMVDAACADTAPVAMADNGRLHRPLSEWSEQQQQQRATTEQQHGDPTTWDHLDPCHPSFAASAPWLVGLASSAASGPSCSDPASSAEPEPASQGCSASSVAPAASPGAFQPCRLVLPCLPFLACLPCHPCLRSPQLPALLLLVLALERLLPRPAVLPALPQSASGRPPATLPRRRCTAKHPLPLGCNLEATQQPPWRPHRQLHLQPFLKRPRYSS